MPNFEDIILTQLVKDPKTALEYGSKVDNWDEVQNTKSLFLSEQGNSTPAHGGSISALTILSNGYLATASSSDKTINIWNSRSGQFQKKFEGEKAEGRIKALAALPGNKLAYTSGHEVILWDSLSGEYITTLSGHNAEIPVLMLLSNGLLASGSTNGTIGLWDTKKSKGKLISPNSRKIRGVISIAELTNGLLVSGTIDGYINVLDIRNGKHQYTFEAHKGSRLTSLTVLANNWLASSSEDGNIKLWDVRDNISYALKTLAEKNNNELKPKVMSLAALSSGWLASSSTDKKIRIWDVHSGQCFKTIEINESISFLKHSYFPLIALPGGGLAASIGTKTQIYRPPKKSLLLMAVEKGNNAAVSCLLEQKIIIDEKNEQGQNALMLAAKNNHLEILDQLTGTGINLATKDNLGDTALMIAIKHQQDEAIRYLVTREPQLLTYQNNKNKTPLMLAEEMENQELAKWLTSQEQIYESTREIINLHEIENIKPTSTATKNLRKLANIQGGSNIVSMWHKSIKEQQNKEKLNEEESQRLQQTIDDYDTLESAYEVGEIPEYLEQKRELIRQKKIAFAEEENRLKQYRETLNQTDETSSITSRIENLGSAYATVCSNIESWMSTPTNTQMLGENLLQMAKEIYEIKLNQACSEESLKEADLRLSTLEALHEHQLIQRDFEQGLNNRVPSLKYFYFRFVQYFGRLLRAAELSTAGLRINADLTELGLSNIVPIGDKLINLGRTAATIATGIPIPGIPLFGILGKSLAFLHRRERLNTYKMAASLLGPVAANEEFVACLGMYLCESFELQLIEFSDSGAEHFARGMSVLLFRMLQHQWVDSNSELSLVEQLLSNMRVAACKHQAGSMVQIPGRFGMSFELPAWISSLKIELKQKIHDQQKWEFTNILTKTGLMVEETQCAYEISIKRKPTSDILIYRHQKVTTSMLTLIREVFELEEKEITMGQTNKPFVKAVSGKHDKTDSPRYEQRAGASYTPNTMFSPRSNSPRPKTSNTNILPTPK